MIINGEKHSLIFLQCNEMREILTSIVSILLVSFLEKEKEKLRHSLNKLSRAGYRSGLLLSIRVRIHDVKWMKK